MDNPIAHCPERLITPEVLIFGIVFTALFASVAVITLAVNAADLVRAWHRLRGTRCETCDWHFRDKER